MMLLPLPPRSHNDGALALAHMRENCRRDLPWFIGRPPHEGRMVIVGGGPSLHDTVGGIKRRKKYSAAAVVALNGAAKFLKSHKIKPDLVAFVDPSPAVLGFLDGGDHEYLVASICHPSVFDALADKRVIVWHPDILQKEQLSILAEYPSKPSVLIGGGNTVGLRMPNIGFLFGYRNIHMYGVDSSYATDGADHAYVKHDGTEPPPVTIVFEGKKYFCSPWMARQADDFKSMYQLLRASGCMIFVHGDGLIPDIWKAMNAAVRSKAA